jgi:hypothetical protein
MRYRLAASSAPSSASWSTSCSNPAPSSRVGTGRRPAASPRPASSLAQGNYVLHEGHFSVPFSVRFLCRSNFPFVRVCGGTRFLRFAPVSLPPAPRPPPPPCRSVDGITDTSLGTQIQCTCRGIYICPAERPRGCRKNSGTAELKGGMGQGGGGGR